VPLKGALTAFAAGAIILLYIAAFFRQELTYAGVHIATFGITGFALIGGASSLLRSIHCRVYGVFYRYVR